MRLGIDASNLREGGGVTHLVEMLAAARPPEFGFDQVTVWGGGRLLQQLRPRDWLRLCHEPLLDGRLASRLYWQARVLPRRAARSCDCLLVPGGLFLRGFHPCVTMCRNLLPFAPHERRRYGWSFNRLRLALLSRLQRRSFANADGLIFLNDFAREVVTRDTGVRGRTAVIAHGISRDFFLAPRRQRPLSEFNPQSPLRILYISLLDVYKHQWQVARAVAGLRREGIPVELELVGPAYPPSYRQLKAVLQQVDPAGQFVHYRGPAGHSEIPRYLASADLFVFASSCENMPNILLEAMAAGLPIACSDRRPMPDVLHDAAIYFDPERAHSIATALRHLMHDPQLRERCASAAFQQAAAYSWERCADRTFEFLARVARQHYDGETEAPIPALPSSAQ